MTMVLPQKEFFWYRYRFLVLYIIYGVCSLGVETFITSRLLAIGLDPAPAYVTGITAGILFAFLMNTFFNFRIPTRRFLYSLVLFVFISLFSFGAQLVIRSLLKLYWVFSPVESRFLVSGAFFLISYLLHRKLTFRGYKKVGVAVYLNEQEPIAEIYKKVRNYPSFIHVDVVDPSFQAGCSDPAIERMETIYAWWNRNVIDVHIMSRHPSKYLDAVLPYASVVYLHRGIDEDLHSLFERIRSAGVIPGIALPWNASAADVKDALKLTSRILILAIARPGISGQVFQPEVFELIREINRLPDRNDFNLCVDGGINLEISQQLDVEKVVSASYVLNKQDSRQCIMELQTEGKYAGNHQ